MFTAANLLLCDWVHEDQKHNVTLLGVFTEVTTPCFPSHPLSLSGYVLLNGDPGEVGEITWQLLEEETGFIYFQDSQRVQLGKNGQRHVRMRFWNARLPRPGKYHVAASVDGNVLAQQTMHVRRVP